MEVFLLVTAGWVFSVCLHEFGHAVVAYYGGDHTVKEKGYLTLNPIHYSHPVYSLVMPLVFLFLGGIGLPGGAVYINNHLLRSRGWRTAVSLAGPLMNALLVLLLCIPFWLGIIDQRFGPALAFLIQLELSAIVFNLVPVPPLDGFQALAPWIPQQVSEKLLANANVFMWTFILVLCYVLPANHAFWSIVRAVSNLLGIDYKLALTGQWQFQFWHR